MRRLDMAGGAEVRRELARENEVDLAVRGPRLDAHDAEELAGGQAITRIYERYAIARIECVFVEPHRAARDARPGLEHVATKLRFRTGDSVCRQACTNGRGIDGGLMVVPPIVEIISSDWVDRLQSEVIGEPEDRSIRIRYSGRQAIALHRVVARIVHQHLTELERQVLARQVADDVVAGCGVDRHNAEEGSTVELVEFQAAHREETICVLRIPGVRAR